MGRERDPVSTGYLPEWLLERRRRVEAALASMVATCYLLGESNEAMHQLVTPLGISGLSKSPGLGQGDRAPWPARAAPVSASGQS